MELIELPSWIGEVGSAIAVLMAVIIMARVNNITVPFLRELNQDREEVSKERKQLYEKSTAAYEALTNELRTAMTVQREVFVEKLAALDREHSIERDKWVEQIKQLNTQIQALTERIAKLEKEAQDKDGEIERLKAELANAIAERDAALAKLKAVEAAEVVLPVLPTKAA